MSHFLQCAVVFSLSSPSSSSTGFRNCIASKSGISSNLGNSSNTTPKCYASLSNKLYRFKVVCLVAWLLHDSEAEVDLGQATKHTQKKLVYCSGIESYLTNQIVRVKSFQFSFVAWVKIF